MILFNSNIHVVYVMLGDKCNFQCRYCIQGDKCNKSVSLPDGLSPAVIAFLKNLCASQPIKPILLFYGGEPLIYLDKIKTIMKSVAPHGARFNMITNGSLITDNVIKLFNQFNACLTVSWDGKASIDTRKVDVFNDVELKTCIFKVNHFGINSVISARSYPIQACEDIQVLLNEYREVNPDGEVGLNFDEIIDNNLQDRELLQFDYDRLEEEIAQIVDKNIEWLLSVKKSYIMGYGGINIPFNDRYAERIFLYKYLDLIRTYRDTPNAFKYISPCKDGLCRLGLDMAGNLYSCHDSREIIGNIKNLDLHTYVANYIKFDNTKELYNTLCKNCKYYPLCHGRCKLLTIEARVNHTCKFKQAVGRPLFKALEM